ncbi:hypothetical protein ACFY5H_02150 [Streptomyces sp. NPDC013012]|uniref:hypothetical protein n=1 Tax=Streptomyces sp. NPDC013012 TaxID=3364860 RepID=UPI0036947851
MRRRTVAALLLPLVLAGCGIRETDVVEAGGAATVLVQPVPEDRMTLYFVGPDGRMMPMVRDTGRPWPSTTSPAGETVPYDGFGPEYEISAGALRRERVTTEKVLAALMAGPVDREAAAGATTALPQGGKGAPRVEAGPGGPSARTRRLRVSFPVQGLPEAAVRQLVCTTAFAEDPTGRTEVTVTGPDGSLPAAGCEG